MCDIIKKLNKVPATIIVCGAEYTLHIEKLDDDYYTVEYTDDDGNSLFIGGDSCFYGCTLNDVLTTVIEEIERYKMGQ